MKDTVSSISAKAGVLLGLIFVAFTSGCVVEPHEGYYDRDHHRYWHENGWHDCGERDDHCR